MATIREIAKKADVSVATVSRILNNDASLNASVQTRQKVFKIAKELGYTKKNKTGSKAAFKLGIIQWFSAEHELEDSYYLSIRKGIEDFCVNNCIQITRAFKSDIDYLEQLKDVDGLICIGKFSKREANNLIHITKNIVFLDMPLDDYSVTTFTLDFKMAVYGAMDYLTNLGHRKIAFLGGREYVENNIEFQDQRKESFLSYCHKNNFNTKNMIKIGSYSIESGYQMMHEMIQEQNLPTAVFAASDNIAFGAMKAIQEHGLKIPEDISIIGFDDSEICDYTTPSLTTIHAPAYDMGQYGVNFLFAASNLSIATPLKVKMPCTLIERKSCRKIS